MSGSMMAPVAPAAQPIGAGTGMSQLAASLMGHPSNFSLPPTVGNLSAPLITMLMQQHMQDAANPPGPYNTAPPSLPGQAAQGVGNLLTGSTWNGWPGAGQTAALSGQAAGNIAGGAAGL